MKNFKYTIRTSAILVVFFLTLVIACKEEAEELSLSRQFSPSKITSVNGETQVTITWASSLFTTVGDVSYAVEISDNASDFSNPVIKATVPTTNMRSNTTGISVIITDEKLTIKKDYYARVKALGADDTADSNWLMSSAFRILGEQFLLPVTGDELIDVGVLLKWKPNPTLTKIVVTPTGGAPITVSLSAADIAANSKAVMGLTQLTNYSAEIFQDTKTKGTVTFKTEKSVTGNIVDISVSGDLSPSIGSAPAGSVIFLGRGKQYILNANFSKSVTIMSKPDFGTNFAIVRSSSTANGVTASIDSIVFRDLVIKGGKALNASYDADYIINVGTAVAAGTTVNRIRLDNCTIKIFRGVVRQNTANIKFNDYIVNNCVIDSIKDFSIAQASVGQGFGNIRITNTTVYKSRKIITHNPSNGPLGSLSVLIENSTFNETPSNNGTNFMIDYNANNVTNGITIRNCIIGGTWVDGAGVAPNGIRVGSATNVSLVTTYTTSDFVVTSNPIPGALTYSGTSTALFTSPSTGNFKIKDTNFAGKSTTGDPRWRIN